MLRNAYDTWNYKNQELLKNKIKNIVHLYNINVETI